MNTGHDIVQSQARPADDGGVPIQGQPAHYALEGSVAITGALVQWIRDNFGLIDTSPEIEALARRSRTTAASTSCRRFPACTRPTGNTTRAA